MDRSYSVVTVAGRWLAAIGLALFAAGCDACGDPDEAGARPRRRAGAVRHGGVLPDGGAGRAVMRLGQALDGGGRDRSAAIALAAILPERLGDLAAAGAVTVDPVAAAAVRRAYRGGDLAIEVSIVDTRGDAALTTGFRTGRGGTVDSDGRYQRPIDLQGAPGFEIYQLAPRRARVVALIDGRFLVEASGGPVNDPDPVAGALRSLDLARLRAIR